MFHHMPTPFGVAAGDALKKRLTWLALFRLAAVPLLLGGALALGRGLPPTVQLASWTGVLIMAIPCALTLIYALLARYSPAYRVQAYLQMIGDVFLVTGLVYLTGTIDSPFTALYLIIIFVTSSLVSRRGTFALTALASAFYVAL